MRLDPFVRILARKVCEGVARGKVAKSSVPLSFLGEMDSATGKIENAQSELHGRVVAGTILAFPEARGSTVGPYVLYGARKNGVAPAALVVAKADAIVASAAVLAGTPCITSVQMEALLDGDEAVVNATEGYLDLPEVTDTPVVTVMLVNPKGELLILKRSQRVGSFQGHWAGVSGYLEERSPLEQALLELEEETGLGRGELQLVTEGPLIYARDGARGFTVHPFLFRCTREDIRIDWEHTEFKWIDPKELGKYPTPPGLGRVWAALAVKG